MSELTAQFYSCFVCSLIHRVSIIYINVFIITNSLAAMSQSYINGTSLHHHYPTRLPSICVYRNPTFFRVDLLPMSCGHLLAPHKYITFKLTVLENKIKQTRKLTKKCATVHRLHFFDSCLQKYFTTPPIPRETTQIWSLATNTFPCGIFKTTTVVSLRQSNLNYLC